MYIPPIAWSFMLNQFHADLRIARRKKPGFRMRSRHALLLEQGGPYYNPNFTRNSENMAICINHRELPVIGGSNRKTYNMESDA